MTTPEETSPETWNPAEVYKANDPVGWGGDPAFGSALGRNDIKEIPQDSDLEFTIHIERILLIEGYDPNGTYFGQGMPLFWIYGVALTINRNDEDDILTMDYVERFTDIEDAVRVVQETWPRAKVIASEAWCDELVDKYMDEEYERERDEEEAHARFLAEDRFSPQEERVIAARRVCELLVAHQPTYDESGYFDTTCLPELFRLAASAIDPE